MPRLSDTTPEAERVLAEAYRRMPAERKWRIVREELRRIRLLHDFGYLRRHPEATPDQIRRAWVEALLGPISLFDLPEVPFANAPIEQLETLRDVISALDRLGIAHALGGSLASAVHGAVRATRDADLALDHWAAELGMVDLLGKAWDEARL
ncbi:hypothetical protein [Tautonia rosea]|uniref:hypothetical protein n=1 Tax=Tautonia rosea TaxID=2728037 RepID=UPI0014765788|nr:hypothetical protein [Tautonia rosea]